MVQRGVLKGLQRCHVRCPLNIQASSRGPAPHAQFVMFLACALAMVGNYYVYDSIGPVADMLTGQLGFSDTQLGTLNAIYSLPNIFMVLIGGVLCDRFNARSVALVAALLCFLGSVLTAISGAFVVMAAGRLLFGLGAETMIVAVTVALAQWFGGRNFALFFALNLSVARLGSYLADRSPSFARDLYAQGWQPPLWLAAVFGAVCFSARCCTSGWIGARRRVARSRSHRRRTASISAACCVSARRIGTWSACASRSTR